MPDRFYDGQRGPDIRRELNNLEAVFEDAIANAKGPQGWAPVVAVVTDGERSVLQITDWVGGEGSKPAVTGFIGATGIVTTAALAVDIRGVSGRAVQIQAGVTHIQWRYVGDTSWVNLVSLASLQGDQGLKGDQGDQGIKGDQGLKGDQGETGLKGDTGDAGSNGWTYILATVPDGERIVHQIIDWVGGTGTKPAVGVYLGTTGYVVNIADAADFRGAAGAGAGDVLGPATSVAGNFALFADTAGKTIVDGGVPGSAAFQNSTAFATALQGGLAETALQVEDVATVATSGDYDDLTNKPVIPAAQQQTDWNAVSGITSIANKPAVIAAGVDAAAARSVIGAASLVGGKIPEDELPAIAITDVFPVASEAAMLALTAEKGDVAIRSDINKCFALSAPPASTLANWLELKTPINAVLSVAGKTGAVTLVGADVGLSNVDDTSDADKPVSNATQAALDSKVGGNAANNIGYLNVPQNSQSVAYTCVLGDAGKHIFHPAADTTARTYTIPANASVPYPIGTAITFINQNGTGGVVTIAITTDTMRLAGAGTTGSRTLARNGVATATKITSTEWIISGVGLT